jgi:hypothetical protein
MIINNIIVFLISSVPLGKYSNSGFICRWQNYVRLTYALLESIRKTRSLVIHRLRTLKLFLTLDFHHTNIPSFCRDGGAYGRRSIRFTNTHLPISFTCPTVITNCYKFLLKRCANLDTFLSCVVY